MAHDDGQEERAQGGRKVINLQGHQAAETRIQALLALDRASTEYQSALTSTLGLGRPLLAAVVRRLDSSQPRELLALGDVVVRFPARLYAVQALLRAAADTRQSDSRRLGAMLLMMSRYLRASAPEDFVLTLQHPAESVAQAILAAVQLVEDDPTLLRDCLGSFQMLLSQSPDLLYSVIGHLASMPGDAPVPALRLLATQPHPDLASAAIEALTGGELSGGTSALEAIEANLIPEDARPASRHLQKLRLAGAIHSRHSLAAAEGCRARLGPLDAWGRRSLELEVPPAGAPGGKRVLVSLELMRAIGITGLAVSAGAPAEQPDRRPPGQTANGVYAPGPLVEVPFDYALATLRTAVRAQWEHTGQLPVEYRLLIHPIWRFGSPAEPQPRDLSSEQDSPVPADLSMHEATLLSDPALAGWYLESEGVQSTAADIERSVGALSSELSHESWRVLLPAVIRLAHDVFGSRLREEYATRFQLMADWFGFAGKHQEAELAEAAARTMVVSPPEANLVVLRLVQRGLLVALSRNQGRS